MDRPVIDAISFRVVSPIYRVEQLRQHAEKTFPNSRIEQSESGEYVIYTSLYDDYFAPGRLVDSDGSDIPTA